MTTEIGPEAQVAIQAFEDVERVRLLLDKKEQALHLAAVSLGVHGTDEDREVYFQKTEAIRAGYEEKRVKAGLPA